MDKGVRPERTMSETRSYKDMPKVCQMSTFLIQKRLNWYGHIRRREEDNLSTKTMDVVVQGKRRRGGLDGDGSTIPGN